MSNESWSCCECAASFARARLKLPFDKGSRRRIYLLRHAEAAYESLGPSGDPRLVPLTPHGREQAAGMAKLLADTAFDRAVCSGLPRTRETAEIVLGNRELPLESVPELEEVRLGARSPWEAGKDLPQALAYAMWSAKQPDGTFLGGERFSALWERVILALEGLLAPPSWSRLLLVCHGAVNRVILSWALAADRHSMPNMEQDSCCLNVIDLDIDAETDEVLRTVVRTLNLTPYDLPKNDQVLTTLELQALRLQRAGRRSGA